MKKIFGFAIALCMSAPFAARANDTEHSKKETTEHSKNPITGTETTTHKKHTKQKGAHGEGHDVEVTETTKHKKNGEVEKKVEVNAESNGPKK